MQIAQHCEKEGIQYLKRKKNQAKKVDNNSTKKIFKENRVEICKKDECKKDEKESKTQTTLSISEDCKTINNELNYELNHISIED